MAKNKDEEPHINQHWLDEAESTPKILFDLLSVGLTDKQNISYMWERWIYQMHLI